MHEAEPLEPGWKVYLYLFSSLFFPSIWHWKVLYVASFHNKPNHYLCVADDLVIWANTSSKRSLLQLWTFKLRALYIIMKSFWVCHSAVEGPHCKLKLFSVSESLYHWNMYSETDCKIDITRSIKKLIDNLQKYFFSVLFLEKFHRLFHSPWTLLQKTLIMI